MHCDSGVHAPGNYELSRLRHRSVTAKLARPEGFEPPTTAFGGQYSIQLSYGRVFRRGGSAERLDTAAGV